MFTVNQALVAEAQARLAGYSGLRWVIGGACTGKSTVCQAIVARRGVACYAMDEHIYGDYMGQYTAERHPASTAWFGAADPLAWVMARTPAEFDALNRAATAEYLDLLAADLRSHDPHQALLIDGGVTHPSLLVQVLAPAQIVCLDVVDAERERIWESAPERAEMRGWVQALAAPADPWRRFLDFDRQINDTLVAESRAHGIPVLRRTPVVTVAALTDAVVAALWP